MTCEETPTKIDFVRIIRSVRLLDDRLMAHKKKSSKDMGILIDRIARLEEITKKSQP